MSTPMDFNPLEQGFFIAQWVKTHWTKDFSEVFSIHFLIKKRHSENPYDSDVFNHINFLE